jgi:hypothetical protein
MTEDAVSETRLLSDIAAARRRHAGFEAIYAGIEGKGKRYLQARSSKYRKALWDVQNAIMDATRMHCPTCGRCCAISAPEIHVYTAGSAGCFEFVDYALARCDTELPNPQFGNMASNRCAYLAEDGCRLPLDSRSFTCTRYLCARVNNDLDMEMVAARLDVLRSILKEFSVLECLERSAPDIDQSSPRKQFEPVLDDRVTA